MRHLRIRSDCFHRYQTIVVTSKRKMLLFTMKRSWLQGVR